MTLICKRHRRKNWEWFLLPILAWSVLLSGCVTNAPTTTGTGMVSSNARSIDHKVYRSEDYIVCLLKEPDTSVNLARHYLGDAKRSWVIEDANGAAFFKKKQTVIIPLKQANKAGLLPEGFQTVPILCYHRFGKNCSSSMCMPSDIFELQMKYLKDNGYRVISLSEMLNFLEYKQAIPKKSVVISVDDGYNSFYQDALPILKKYGFTATLFVYTDFIGTGKSAMTWKQLKEVKGGGFEIGSHSLSHSDLTKKRVDEDEAAYTKRITKEMKFSKKIIDKKLGQDTIYFAFPYGAYNRKVLSLSKEIGYKMGLSVKGGGNPFFSNHYRVKRTQIIERDMESFIARLKTFVTYDLR